jgi:chromosomal replication initiator protein
MPKGFHRQSQLNSRYIFDNFIEGKGNQFAKAASFSVSETPGQTPFNPLLIYSSPGMGKTHLLQAIGNFVLKNRPSMRVVYLTSDKFTLEFITAIQQNKSVEFANNYRNVDMLLIDDVQFLEGKVGTQDQFFHIFNGLYQEGKQIVLTTDRPPGELKGLKDRLISRFQSGLIVDIQSPDLETRIAILMKKAEDDGLEIPYEVVEFIASSIKSDIRTMEGALVRLLALSSLKRVDITMDLAKKVLEDMLGKAAFANVTIDHVLKSVSREMKVSERQISGKGRTMEVALARQISMYLSRELTGSSLINIGRHIGRRDHSTVIHACRTVENKMAKDKEFRSRVDNLKSDISGVH